MVQQPRSLQSAQRFGRGSTSAGARDRLCGGVVDDAQLFVCAGATLFALGKGFEVEAGLIDRTLGVGQTAHGCLFRWAACARVGRVLML